MNKQISNAQFLLRLVLGIGFILPVLDRIGALGGPGSNGVGWGNWSNFVDYTYSLMPYVNRSIAFYCEGLLQL